MVLEASDEEMEQVLVRVENSGVLENSARQEAPRALVGPMRSTEMGSNIEKKATGALLSILSEIRDEELKRTEEEEVPTCHSLCIYMSLTMYSPVTHYYPRWWRRTRMKGGS